MKTKPILKDAVSPAERKKQMVVIAVGKNSTNGVALEGPMQVKFQNENIVLVPGKNTKQITREAAEHIIGRAKRSQLKPDLRMVELKPANELEPDEEDDDQDGADLTADQGAGQDGDQNDPDAGAAETKPKAAKKKKGAK